eukprot:403360911
MESLMIDETEASLFIFPEEAKSWDTKRGLIEQISVENNFEKIVQFHGQLATLFNGRDSEVELLGVKQFNKFWPQFLKKHQIDLVLLYQKLAVIALSKGQFFSSDQELVLLTSNQNDCTTNIKLSNQQMLYLAAHMFFCTLIKPNPDKYNECSFLDFLRYSEDNMQTKLRFLLIYLKNAIEEYESQIAQNSKVPLRYMTIHRNSLSKTFVKYDHSFQYWLHSEKPLTEVILHDKQKIEDFAGQDALMADFANEYIGGGALSWGCVQEEILFLIYPELNIACLFCEKMNWNESLIIKGSRSIDPEGRLENTFVAIDAIRFASNFSQQLLKICINRDLVKSYVGFIGILDGDEKSIENFENGNRKKVVTGNWGCGVFNGCPEIKFILQWLSSSQANRDMIYTTFGNYKFTVQMEQLVKAVQESGKKTVGDLAKIMFSLEGNDEINDGPQFYQHFIRQLQE